jgi:hypothetical protein
MSGRKAEAEVAVIKTGLTPFTLESFRITHLQVPPPPFTLILHDKTQNQGLQVIMGESDSHGQPRNP